MFRIIKHSFFVSIPILLSINQADISGAIPPYYYHELSTNQTNLSEPPEIQKISSLIQKLNSIQDTKGIRNLADSLTESIRKIFPDSIILGEYYYYIGVCNLLTGNYENAVSWLKSSAAVRQKLKLQDDYLAKSYYNLGVAYNFLGDFINMRNYMLENIRVCQSVHGPYSSEVVSGYTYLVSASIELQEYENAIDYANSALDIVNNNKGALAEEELSNLYIAFGTCFARLSDYAKARIYYEKAESVLSSEHAVPGDNFINLINNLAIVYRNLGQTEKQNEYFEKGIALAYAGNSALTYNLVNNYAIFLGSSGDVAKGWDLMLKLVKKARDTYGAESRNYIEVLKNYADFLRIYKKDIRNALTAYLECMNFLSRHKDESILKDPVMIGYALALSESGESMNALEKIQELLFNRSEISPDDSLYINPDIKSITADRRSLNILTAKYQILWDIYSKSKENDVLFAAAATSELIISILEKVRINISEEESRLLLGDRYRNSYLLSIRDFELCYRKTGNTQFLAKAFEYIERSKVAGLLAATRELNAIQFHIPSVIAESEKSIQRDISYYNARINQENTKESPDKNAIADWNEKILTATQRRDSLVLVFEKKYPGYHSLKYNTEVLKMEDIPGIAGRNCNYLNYVASDSILYIFLVNRKYKELVTLRIDSSFLNKIRKFRNLLAMPSPLATARTQFENYQETGFELYKMLVEPVRKYFISDVLLISPDNILSYVPFETLLSEKYGGTDILFRELHYLMNDFRISYAYSATFMQELVKRDYGRRKELIAFAPVYKKAISIDSLIVNRQQSGSGTFPELKYAQMEAKYVTDITGGRLYINEEARESVYKSESPDYAIIHLAMHTLLNDRYPMNSALIFSQASDPPEDGMLYTYEVYGIPLKARMVVLSSCNTGRGLISTGEGILSLARGFLYSGSRSVVMSMWEIEDKSGTEIIEMFYDNLKKGNSKSESLKKARKEYLSKANQLTSHPYFWSTLVIYGDDAPLYKSKVYIISTPIIIIITVFFSIYYFLKRRYS